MIYIVRDYRVLVAVIGDMRFDSFVRSRETRVINLRDKSYEEDARKSAQELRSRIVAGITHPDSSLPTSSALAALKDTNDSAGHVDSLRLRWLCAVGARALSEHRTQYFENRQILCSLCISWSEPPSNTKCYEHDPSRVTLSLHITTRACLS